MPKVAAGFYAVCKGHKVGVFTSWWVSFDSDSWSRLSSDLLRIRSIDSQRSVKIRFWNCG